MLRAYQATLPYRAIRAGKGAITITIGRGWTHVNTAGLEDEVIAWGTHRGRQGPNSPYIHSQLINNSIRTDLQHIIIYHIYFE